MAKAFPSITTGRMTRGRPPHVPAGSDRRLVEILTASGYGQPLIATLLRIDCKTLRRRYRRELDRGAARLEAALVANLFRLAQRRDGVGETAIEFSLRCRFGWSRRPAPA